MRMPEIYKDLDAALHWLFRKHSPKPIFVDAAVFS